MKILVVDDNPINAKILVAHLKSADYETVMAASGKEALVCLETDHSIVLIIADIMMPEMNGLELLRIIRSRASWQGIPVIICSALSDLETVKKAVKEGCKSYMVKPVLKHHLLQKVREALEGNREVLKDKRKVMRHLGINEPDYKDIACDFLAMLESIIPLAEKAENENRSADLSEKLSNLQENAVYLGAERLLDVLEKHNRAETPSHDATGVTDSSFNALLLRELVHVRDALTSHL